jgi:hypothetical protein
VPAATVRTIRCCLALAAALLALTVAVPAAHGQAEPPYLYWDNVANHTLGRAMIDGSNIDQGFITGTSQIDGLGVAADTQHFYWTDGAKLMRSDLEGNGAETLVTMENGGNWLAVDNRYVYIASSGGGWISRVNLDGTGYIQQFITHTSFSREVAVDSEHIYWLTSGKTIGRANLDGSGVDDTFITGVTAYAGLAVDGQYVYWSNPTAGTIGRANLNGSGADSSFITGLSTLGPSSAAGVRGLALDFGHIYWANYYSCTGGSPPCAGGTIGRANLDGTGVQDDFFTASPVGGVGCGHGPGVRCGPTTVAVSGPTQPGRRTR